MKFRTAFSFLQGLKERSYFKGSSMNAGYRAGFFLLCLSSVSLSAFAQQPIGSTSVTTGQLQPAPASAAAGPLVLDVVVTDKAGKAIQGLQEKDFTVLDNGHPQSLLSFHAEVSAAGAANRQPASTPVRIILLVDEVNTTFNRVAYERDQIKRFLLQNDGVLAHPVSMAFFTDTGAEIQDDSSNDGNTLLASFDQHMTALRSIRRSEGFYGAIERFQLSLNTLNALAAREVKTPGRKIVIWISPGWPLLSGPGVELTAKNQAGLFAGVVSASDALRQARITLYSIDPQGAEAAGGIREFYYEEFLKPVTAAKKMQIGNLGLQVFAIHSGGLALAASNDIAGQIARCAADANSFYTLTVDPAKAEQPNEYHTIEVKLGTPGLTGRTRSGYYAQP
jgi:VWFA-related protein